MSYFNEEKKMVKKIIVLIIAVLAGSCIYSFAGNSSAQAEKAYSEGRYAEAAEIYHRISKEYGVSAPLLANMGNVYAKAGDYGHALLYYERSLRLNPSDKSVKSNRAYILSKIEDGNKANAKGKNVSVVAEQPSFFSGIKHYISYGHTSNTWAIWGGVSFVLLCVCIALYVFRSEVLLRKTGFFGAIVLIVFCVVFMSFSFISARASQEHDQGVITGFKVSLLTEPFSSSKPSGTPLERGTRLDILEKEANTKGNIEWYKVRLNSDFVGWIHASEFEVI